MLTDAAALTLPAYRPHWTFGESIESLPRIFDDDVTLSVMQRKFSPALRAAIDRQMKRSRLFEWQWRGAVDESMRGDLNRALSAGPEDALVADVCLLAEAIAYLFETETIGIRLRKLESAMCPRFHVDNLGVRFLTSYAGPGTEWLPDAAADRLGLGAAHPEKPEIVRDASAIQRLGCGDLALMKGAGWEGNRGRGLIHRSPPGRRLLLTIDPC